MLTGIASVAVPPPFSAAPEMFDRLGMTARDWINHIERMIPCEAITSLSSSPRNRCPIRYTIFHRVHLSLSRAM